MSEPSQAPIDFDEASVVRRADHVAFVELDGEAVLQPVFSDCEVVPGSVAADLFDRGLCLPSGSTLTDAEQDEVIDLVRSSRPTSPM